MSNESVYLLFTGFSRKDNAKTNAIDSSANDVDGIRTFLVETDSLVILLVG